MKHLNQSQSGFCIKPWSHLFLHSSGRIQLCCMNSTPLGNIYQHTISDIWNNDKIKQIRELILKKDYAGAGCKKSCFFFLHSHIEQGSQSCNIPPDWERSSQGGGRFGVNFKTFVESLENRLLNVSHLPLSVDIQPTEACNMSCIMCHQQHRKKEQISSEIMDRFLSWTDAIHTLRFQGGEIFMDQNISTFLCKLKSRLKPFQQILIITNGSLLNEKMICELTALPNPIRFIISIDAVEPVVYKKIRRAPLFHRVWKNLTVLTDRQKSIGRNDIVRWNYVVMKSNFHQLYQAVQIATKLSINIDFQPIIGPYPEENIFNYHAIGPEKALDYLEECIQLAASLSVPNASLQNIQRQIASAIP